MQQSPESPASQRRVSNACNYCRKRKIRCSGKQPCGNCHKRKIACHFDDDRKIAVSVRYLQQLEQQAGDKDSQTGPENGQSARQSRLRPSPTPGSSPSRSSADVSSNPLVSATSSYVRDGSGRFRFMGPSSSASYSTRVFSLLRHHFPDVCTVDSPVNTENSTYKLTWPIIATDHLPDLGDLPSLDYSLYLVNTVKFHACQLLRLFDEDDFVKNLHEFHQLGLSKARSSRLWFAQYLLLVALSKGFISTLRIPGTPPGSVYFQKAMSIMPDYVSLTREPLLAIEVLCMVAVYLMSVDMQNAAYGYIHQALSLSIIEDLHRDMPPTVMDQESAQRCRNVWWTVYVLDRQLSSMIGAPCSIQDVEITSRLPSEIDGSQRCVIFSINVQLSKMTAQVINSVYSVKAEYLKMVQVVLRNMASIAQEIKGVVEANRWGTLSSVSGVANRLILLYHHCVVLAIRPLVLQLLSWYLTRSAAAADTQKQFSGPIKKMLETCIQSASHIICTLTTLHEHHLLGSFFFFDLEHAFSAAFVLTIAAVIIPSMIPDLDHEAAIHTIFEYLIRRGSIPAQLRKHELDHLKSLLSPLSAENATTPGADRGNASAVIDQTLDAETSMSDAEVGLSATNMLSIAEQLDASETVTGIEFLSPTYWPWSTADETSIFPAN
ncbi:hypothetical protein PFICI_13992 [Pestalotiopsis fici W106-1]|uniref:Zn(2)-C6 fungal-type domain-containing protein n=1 Tax=Pestalotiopsis fici (strain W106-1 / CGMCC3.15140) TaxID=1229662 RepID=W3WMT0_PESFW|nr:uncharacterized protein PFICI_13992 [Pestalotiopsis fici W106-1]ETS74126.1 hypothetical protein PFICI_13992 [Pestalotiopsis fici W106-1]